MCIFVTLFFSIQANAVSFSHTMRINTTNESIYLTDDFGNHFNFSRTANYENTSFVFFTDQNVTMGSLDLDCGDLVCNPTTNCPEIKIDPVQIPPCPANNCSCTSEIIAAIDGAYKIKYPIIEEPTEIDYTNYYIFGLILAAGIIIYYLYNKKENTKPFQKPKKTFSDEEISFNLPPVPNEIAKKFVHTHDQAANNQAKEMELASQKQATNSEERLSHITKELRDMVYGK